MSQDRELEQYLQGKSEISRAYAELPPVKLPDHLDAAILAEAHRAVGARPGGVSKRRWAVPLSLVATLFVVVMVGLQWPYMSRDAGMPLPAESRPAPAAQDKVAAAPAMVAEERRSAPLRKQEAAPREPAAPAPAPLLMAKPGVMAERKQMDAMPPAAAPVAAAPAMPERLAVENEPAAKAKKKSNQGAVVASEAYQPVPQAAGLVAPRAAAAPPAMAQQPLADAARDEPAAEAPQHWLDRIVKLKQQGKLEDAGRELAAFRKRYPDYVVPPVLQGLPQPAGGR